jgi:hypothetical protein
MSHKEYRALHMPQRTAQELDLTSQFNSRQFHSDPPLPEDCRQSPNR